MRCGWCAGAGSFGLPPDQIVSLLCLPSLRSGLLLLFFFSPSFVTDGVPNTGINSLCLRAAGSAIDSSNDGPAIPLQIALRHLHLNDLSLHQTHRPLLAALLAATSALSLSVLGDGWSLGESPISSLPANITLSASSTVAMLPAACTNLRLWLRDSLSTSTSIQHLSATRLCPEHEVHSSIPYPIATLTLTERLTAESLAVLINGLRTKTSFSALKELKLAARIVAGPRRVAFEEVMRICEERGTKVVFAG